MNAQTEEHLPDPNDLPVRKIGRAAPDSDAALIGATRKRAISADRTDSANDRQVGGAHYGGTGFQHWDLVVLFDLDYFQGQVTKYVLRWNKKNGVEDLKKAQHFLEKYIEEIEAGRIHR